MQLVDLHVEPVLGTAPAERRALFLHGILGSGANLRTIARRFVEARPAWEAWLVDLRGHGSSPKGTPEPSLAAAAADVRALCTDPSAGQSEGPKSGGRSVPVAAILGHSFGGKVALEAMQAGIEPRPLRAGGPPIALEHVVTIDSNPGTREPPRDGESALSVFETVQALPPLFPSRQAFVQALIDTGRPRALAQWLAMSTQSVPGGGVRFALDLAEIHALMHSYFATDLWPAVASPPEPTQVHQIIGERSDSYSAEDRVRAHALAQASPRVTVDLLPTHHWVHAEDPDGLLRVLLARIPA